MNNDLIEVILEWRKCILASITIQKLWRSYRIKVLIGRFRLLRYIKDFRSWNPSITVFLNRAIL